MTNDTKRVEENALAHRLLLIRHGQTAHNLENRYTGWGDVPLNSTGLRQAERMAAHLAANYHLERLYVSPLTRTRQTASAIARATGLEPVVRLGLRELHFGHIEGLTIQEARRRFIGMKTASQVPCDVTFSYPGGERLAEFFWRVTRAVQDALVPSEGTVAVVAHGGVIAAYLAQVADGNPLRWLDYSIDNCSISELEFSGKESTLLRVNETSFLDQLVVA